METTYLLALVPYIPVWMYMNMRGSVQIRKEMLVMSFLVATVSPIASYLWWNKDWWLPPSLWGGKITLLFQKISCLVFYLVV